MICTFVSREIACYNDVTEITKEGIILDNELTYHREGDYLLPDLLPPEPLRVGIWGIRRRDYLKAHQNGIYNGMLLSGKLSAHLEEIDRSANEVFELLTRQYAQREGVTEELKAFDQMAWVQRMNSIRARVEEIICAELIYQ